MRKEPTAENVAPGVKKFRTLRLGVIPELDEALEKDRLSIPLAERPNKSNHIRKILWDYVKAKKAERTKVR